MGSEAALESMARVWARELAERATVNVVSVGCTKDTGLYECMPREMAYIVAPPLSNTPMSTVRSRIDWEETAKYLRGKSAYKDEAVAVVSMTCSAESA